MNQPKLPRTFTRTKGNPLAPKRPLNQTILAAILFCFFTIGAASAQLSRMGR